MRINPIIYGVLVLVVFFGIILGFQAAGIWSISGKVTASGEQAPALCCGCQYHQRLDDPGTDFNHLQCAPGGLASSSSICPRIPRLKRPSKTWKVIHLTLPPCGIGCKAR